jgi:transcriptional regulator with XRE-family HTH domain
MDRDPQLVLLGKNIRRLRLKARYSQEGFAAEVKMDRSYYGRVERGERSVSSLKLIRIAEILGKEVGTLFPKMEELIGKKKGPHK